jgi:hypothetical protein
MAAREVGVRISSRPERLSGSEGGDDGERETEGDREGREAMSLRRGRVTGWVNLVRKAMSVQNQVGESNLDFCETEGEEGKRSAGARRRIRLEVEVETDWIVVRMTLVES